MKSQHATADENDSSNARVRKQSPCGRNPKWIIALHSLPNAKDEPRPWLARRVHREDLNSEFSFEEA